MSTITVRNAAVSDTDLARTWIEATFDLRGDDLPLSERSSARSVDLS